MKTTLLSQLHQKCLDVLEIAAKAEEKQRRLTELVVRHQLTTFQNELKLWPIGKPRIEPIKHDLQITNLALTRLEAYYVNLLGRIYSQLRQMEYEQAAA